MGRKKKTKVKIPTIQAEHKGGSWNSGECPYCGMGPYYRLNTHIAKCHKDKKEEKKVDEILEVPVRPSLSISLYSCQLCHYVTISETEIDRHLAERHWSEELQKYHADWQISSKRRVEGIIYVEGA